MSQCNGGIDLSHAWTETPSPSLQWQTLNNEQRIDLIRRESQFAPLECLGASADGLITLKLWGEFSAGQRGELLRKMEYALRLHKAPGITVYLEAAADKNALRQLRGVKPNG